MAPVPVNAMENFTRNISLHAERGDGDLILLTARLEDVYHDIVLDVQADLATLTIQSARARFDRAPSRECPAALAQLEKLTGFTIGRRLNLKLLAMFGGREGCGNILLMLTGLLPLAMNVRAAAGIDGEQAMLAAIRDGLSGSCAGYPSAVPEHVPPRRADA